MSVKLNEYIDFKDNYVDTFFPKDNDTWSSRVLVECMDNINLMSEIKEYLTLDVVQIDSQKLDDIFSILREKSVYNFNLAMECNSSIDECFDFVSKGMLYYGILESLNELSSFSSNLINEIKKEYGNNFLNIIQKIDKSCLSNDHKLFFNIEDTDKVIVTDDLLKKYIVMKKWQDEQHEFYLKVVEPFAYEVEKKYIDNNPLPFELKIDYPHFHKKILQLISKDLIDLEQLSKFYLAGMGNELVKLVGGKSYGLMILNSLGIKVPKTYVIPITANKFNLDNCFELEKEKHYAIRSSADVEDGKNNSFAGMFDSYLNISYENILESVDKVINSKYNNRLQEYININNLSQPEISVIIQEFREPEYAGVWLGESATSGVLEYVSGSGEKLVSGKVIPKREIWIDNTCKNEHLISSKEGFVGAKLLELQKKFINNSSNVADFEWMILDGELIMLQYRPVTSKIALIKNELIENEFTNEGKQVFNGIGASSGVVTGPARFINGRVLNEINDWHDGDILMAWFTDPEWMRILSKASGVVTAVGGFLCHTAIVARELGIPCVIGIGQNMKELWDEKAITVDGNKGIVHGVVKTKKLID